MATAIRALELHYPMIQFLVIFHLYHRMKEKYEMNTKHLRALTIDLLSESLFLALLRETEHAIRNLLR